MNRDVYQLRMQAIASKPELLMFYHNDPIIHAAIKLWASQELDKETAYEQAIIALAKENARLMKWAIRVESMGVQKSPLP